MTDMLAAAFWVRRGRRRCPARHRCLMGGDRCDHRIGHTTEHRHDAAFNIHWWPR